MTKRTKEFQAITALKIKSCSEATKAISKRMNAELIKMVDQMDARMEALRPLCEGRGSDEDVKRALEIL